MDGETFAELVDDFAERFPPKDGQTARTPGRPGRWLVDSQTPALVAVAVGYAAVRPLERFLQIVDTRSISETQEWSLNQKRAWTKNNQELLNGDAVALFLRASVPSGRSGREPELWEKWEEVAGSYDWARMGAWGPGSRPVGQTWRLERLQLLYVVTAALSYSVGDHIAQLFLLGRNPCLGAAPLQLISDSGRDEAEEVLSALSAFFRMTYPEPEFT